MRSLLQNNEKVLNAGSGNGFIGNVVQVFGLDGKLVLPEQLWTVKGCVIEVVAFISQETLKIGGVKKNNFYADVSYMSILHPAPPRTASPAQARGFMVMPSCVLKRKLVS